MANDPEQVFLVVDAAAMRELGRHLAAGLRSGDVVVLTGPLGAGKTTLTQGIAEGLGVAGRVTSPTFVIAREHPSLGHGPGLLHVDAYRLEGVKEVDDLDLELSMADCVMVVEWGKGVAEHLAGPVIEVVIERGEDDSRRVVVRGPEQGRPLLADSSEESNSPVTG